MNIKISIINKEKIIKIILIVINDFLIFYIIKYYMIVQVWLCPLFKLIYTN